VNGYWGRLLRIDLKRRESKVQRISPQFARRWIGGKGWEQPSLEDLARERSMGETIEAIFLTGPSGNDDAHASKMMVPPSPLDRLGWLLAEDISVRRSSMLATTDWWGSGGRAALFFGIQRRSIRDASMLWV